MIDMFEKILEGVAPTEVFKRMLESEPALDNGRLAARFRGYFENVSGLAEQLIWHWERPGYAPGMKDEKLDKALIELLRKAGYPVPDPRNPGTP